MTFSDLGYQKAQLEIQQQEENSLFLSNLRLSHSLPKLLFMSLKHWIQLPKNLACLETHLF